MKKSIRYSLSALTLLGLVALPLVRNELRVFKQAQVQDRIREQKQQEQAEEEALLAKYADQFRQHFYYQQLTQAEQVDYIRLVEALRQFATGVTLTEVMADSPQRVYLSVLYDFPEFYWLAEEAYLQDPAHLTYPADVQQTYQELQQLADEIVAQLPQGSDYDKVKYLYEYVITNTDYHVEALTNDTIAWQTQGIRSALLDKLSVCAGYSRTFQFLCQRAGLESIYVVGDLAGLPDYTHAWNLVKIDGQYYPIDTTWGDPVFEGTVGEPTKLGNQLSYAFLCMPKALFEKTHQPWSGFMARNGQELSYPELAADGLNHYALTGQYFERYDQQQVGQHVLEQLRQPNQTSVSIQFATAEAYEQAVANLTVESTFLHDYLQALPNYMGFQLQPQSSAQVVTIALMTS